MKLLIFILFSLSVHAEIIQALPQRLHHFFRAAQKVICLLAIPQIRKIDFFQDTHVLPKPQQQELENLKKDRVLSKQVQEFDWETFLLLEEASENGSLSYQDQIRYAELLRKYKHLENLPGFEPLKQKESDTLRFIQAHSKVPGMRTAGAGCIKESTPPTPSSSGSEQSETLSEAEESPPLNNGFLDLSRISNAVLLLNKLNDEEAQAVTHLILQDCKIQDCPDFSRFNNLIELDISKNQICALSSTLPGSLERLIANGNRIQNLPNLSHLKNLSYADFSFNQLDQFPTELYHTLGSSQSSTTLRLEGNIDLKPPSLKPILIFNHVLLSLDNTDILMNIFSIGNSETSVLFRETFPSKILENQLYLGALEHIQEFELLHRLGITHVMNAANLNQDQAIEVALENLQKQGVQVINLMLHDSGIENINLCETALIIHNILANNGRILVNCRQGISRSATVVIAYLMLHQNKSLEEAIAWVKTQRPKINPNGNFMRQLVDLALELNPEQNIEDLIQALKDIFDLEVTPQKLREARSSFETEKIEKSEGSEF